jgi:hypothetical protein
MPACRRQVRTIYAILSRFFVDFRLICTLSSRLPCASKGPECPAFSSAPVCRRQAAVWRAGHGAEGSWQYLNATKTHLNHVLWVPHTPNVWVGLGVVFRCASFGAPHPCVFQGVDFLSYDPLSSRNNLRLVVRLSHVRSAPTAQYIFIFPFALVHHQYFCSTFLVRTTPRLSFFHHYHAASPRSGCFLVLPALRRIDIRCAPPTL